MSNELGEYAVRAGPACATTGLHFLGMPIADVVQLAVLLYTVLQIGFFLKKKFDGR